VSELGEITPCWTITFHRKSKHSPERLWAAITDPGFVSRWWDRGAARIDLRVGGEYYVDFADGSTLDGTIVRLEPGRLLAYVWGMSVIEWTIEPDGEGSRYTFVDHGNRPPPEDADWTSEGVASGYHEGLDGLEALLDGSPRQADTGGWQRLMAAYRPLIDSVMKARP
jgi:uncharacterized protein YndB with AHSA1/START domain